MTKRTATSVWLTRARITDDPAGDLIKDMRGDPNIPELFPNIGAMRGYLHLRNACPEAIAVVPIVWRRYAKWLDRNGASWSSQEN